MLHYHAIDSRDRVDRISNRWFGVCRQRERLADGRCGGGHEDRGREALKEFAPSEVLAEVVVAHNVDIRLGLCGVNVWSSMRRIFRKQFGGMRRAGIAATLASVLGTVGFERTAHAQSTGGYAGEWTLAFASESRSGEPNLKPSPWITFTATVVQVDSTLGGAMRSDGLTGQFGCRLRGGACTAGRMRLSWDDQDWQLFEFTLDAGSTSNGAGRAEIRFPDGVVHRYTFVISRR